MSRRLIGLAGFRQTGKSLIAKHLCENHGFKSVHPFNIWKDGIITMYTKIGITPDKARDMVYGNQKDVPCDALPDNKTSRWLMERMGKFAGTELGADWTLGLTLNQMELQYPNEDLVVESIVYETNIMHLFGGHIIMVERPQTKTKGFETDKATMEINPDSRFLNDGNDPEKIKIEFDAHMEQHGLMQNYDNIDFND